MRLGRTSWIILGIGILIIAAVTLYMLYRGQMNEQESLNDSLANEEAAIQLIDIQRQALEDELAQLENDLDALEGENSQLETQMSQLEADLSRLETEREQAIEQALLSLTETEAKFFSSVESIEYDEVLFGFAHDTNLEVGSLTVSEPTDEDIEGITYATTSFTIDLRGDVANIINFVNAVVTDEAFKTAVLKPVNVDVPQPLTDKEKEEIEGAIRAKLIEEATAEVEAKLTIEDWLGFWVEAIEEVTGITVDMNTTEEIAGGIRDAIAGADQDIVDMLPEDLAELILQHVYDSIMQLVDPVAQQLNEMILGEDPEDWEEAIEDLLGMTVVVPDWLHNFVEELKAIVDQFEREIAGSLQGDISGLLRTYISNLVEEKMMDSVEALVDDGLVAELAADEVKAKETPSSSITLIIYTYEGA